MPVRVTHPLAADPRLGRKKKGRRTVEFRAVRAVNG